MDSTIFLTAAEVASEFNVDSPTLERFVREGVLGALSEEGQQKFSRQDLQSLVDSGRVSPITAEIRLDRLISAREATLGKGEGYDEVSYIEIDEKALAEHAVSQLTDEGFEDRTPVVEIGILKNTPQQADANALKMPQTEPYQYLHSEPSDASPPSVSSVQIELKGPSSNAGTLSDSAFELDDFIKKTGSDSDVWIAKNLADSDSDVQLSDAANPNRPSLAQRLPDSDSDVRIADNLKDSDSDVRLASHSPSGLSEDAGIMPNVGTDTKVPASHSSLKKPQSVNPKEPVSLEKTEPLEKTSLMHSFENAPAVATRNDSEKAAKTAASGSAIDLGDDSGISLFDLEDSGITLDSGSDGGPHAAGSSIVLSGADSGVTLEIGDPDHFGLDNYSGLTLAGESGISLETGDSGISLGAPDSGLAMLSASDSGIRLSSKKPSSSPDDLGATTFKGDDPAKTQMIESLSNSGKSLNVSKDLSQTRTTGEISILDEDDFETAGTPVPSPERIKDSPGLTDAFRMDDSPAVDELDIADELEAGFGVEDQDIFDAEEAAFNDDDEYPKSNEYPSSAAEMSDVKKSKGQREPAWGLGMSIGLIACSVVLAVNSVVIWAGVSSMWSGAEGSGIASGIIAQLAGLI